MNKWIAEFELEDNDTMPEHMDLNYMGAKIDFHCRPMWIPVSERLPEDEQEILFSTKTGRVHSGKYHDDDSANQWYSHRDKYRAWNNVVNAWMPLPEPYKPQERSEKE